jgi:hypothetical protein
MGDLEVMDDTLWMSCVESISKEVVQSSVLIAIDEAIAGVSSYMKVNLRD